MDLVCRVRRRNELVFVEVKTRSSIEWGAPHEAVDAQKRLGIIAAAQEWLEMLNRPEVIARFDIVEVFASERHWRRWEIRHHPNAFLAAETLHPGSLKTNLEASRVRDRPASERANAEPSRRRRPRC